MTNILGKLNFMEGSSLSEKLLMYAMIGIIVSLFMFLGYIGIVIAPEVEMKKALINEELSNDNCIELKEYLKENLETLTDSQITKAYVKLEITC